MRELKRAKQSSASSSINGDPSTSSTPNAGQLFKLCCEHSYSQLTSSSSSDPSTSVFLISSPPGNRPDGEEESGESHSDEKVYMKDMPALQVLMTRWLKLSLMTGS